MLNKYAFFGSLIIFILVSSSCQSEKKDPLYDRIEIPLTIKMGNPNIFDDNISEIHFVAPLDRQKKYYSHLLASTKGYPKLDTGMIAQKNTNLWRYYYKLYKGGFLEDSMLIKRFEGQNNDSLGYNLELDDKLLLFTGIRNNKQIVIIDENKNYDFSDDKTIQFDRDFSADSLKSYNDYTNLPVINYTYEKFDKGEIIKYSRYVAIYPNANHQFTGFFRKSPLNKKLHIMGKYLDYWHGQIKLDDKTYTFHCQGTNRNYLTILVKPDSLELATNDFTKNLDFEYLLKDTVQLANQSFAIDSFDYAKSKLILRKLAVNSKFGYRTGQTLKDLQLEDLNGEKFKISDYSTTKKYTLLDFWGTWCPPCLETTPILQNLYNQYPADLEIIGIAYDGSLEKVKDYTTEKNLEWPQAFIKNRTAPGSITNTLRIQYYPTFILLDQDHKIIKRTVSEEGIKEIEKFLLQQKAE
jgi:thiol-disulfide isomerase/thioredoxin